MEFTAIDFETANASRDSACSIGLVTVRDGVIVDEYYQLIRPKTLFFDQRNSSVHGLSQKMVLDQPSFGDLWPELRPRLEHKQLAAHFAKFDLTVLQSTLLAYYLPLPQLSFICSCLLARKAYPELTRHSLDVVAQRLGYKFTHHHALEDAHACAAIICDLVQRSQAQSLEELAAAYQLQLGSLSPLGLTFCSELPGSAVDKSGELSLF